MGVESNSFGEGRAYRLDEDALQINLAEQLPQQRPLMVSPVAKQAWLQPAGFCLAVGQPQGS